MIRFSCPRCKVGLKVRDDIAGRRVNCPKCSDTLNVPQSLDDGLPTAEVDGSRWRARLPLWGWVLVGVVAVVLVMATALITSRATRGPSRLTENDSLKLQGRWKVTSLVIDGMRQELLLPPDKKDWLDRSFVIFDSDRMRTLFPEKSDRATFKLDPAKDPKEITVTWDHKHVDGSVDVGIYDMTGDTLRICLASAMRKARPTSFDTAGEGPNVTLMVLRRER